MSLDGMLAESTVVAIRMLDIGIFVTATSGTQ
jgi:hypothetical protein